MKLFQNTLLVVSAVGAVALVTIGASAQQAALVTNLSSKPFFQSVALNTGERRKMDFSVRVLGSVTGRVFSDAELTAAAGDTPYGIGGVKVTLRSGDPGFANFVLEQFTDESGTYEFQGLRPGKYSVEIDPKDLPANFRAKEQSAPTVTVEPMRSSDAEIPVSTERSISGTVFIDKDNDGHYKQGKDVAVEGAYIVVGRQFTTSDSNGKYFLKDLPSGRVAILVNWPKRADNTHVVLDLASGPVTKRIVDIPMTR